MMEPYANKYRDLNNRRTHLFHTFLPPFSKTVAASAACWLLQHIQEEHLLHDCLYFEFVVCILHTQVVA